MGNSSGRSDVAGCSSASRFTFDALICHPERSEGSLIISARWGSRNGQRCFATLNMTDKTESAPLAPDVEISIEIEHSTLSNKDLAPVPAQRRTWRVASFAAL